MSESGYVHRSRYPIRPEVSESLEMELQAVVGHLM